MAAGMFSKLIFMLKVMYNVINYSPQDEVQINNQISEEKAFHGYHMSTM